MTQQGIIKKVLPDGMAEIEVTRRSACGHDCAKCGGCGGLETQTLYVKARNTAGAGVGERVLIEGETRRVLGLAALAYALPVVMFFVGLVLGGLTGRGEGVAALVGIILFVISMLGVIGYSKKMPDI